MGCVGVGVGSGSGTGTLQCRNKRKNVEKHLGSFSVSLSIERNQDGADWVIVGKNTHSVQFIIESDLPNEKI